MNTDPETVGENERGKKAREHGVKVRNAPNRNDGREENQEPKHIYIPKPAESIQRYKDHGECKRDRTKDLSRKVHHGKTSAKER